MAREESVNRMVEVMKSAVKAYQSGVRIDDSMTYEEARLLNFGRRMVESLQRGRSSLEEADHER